MCSGFPAKMVEQMFMTSLNDVTRGGREGTIKGGSATELEEFWLLLSLLSGCSGTSFRVSTKPQTLYLGCLSAP